MRSTIIPNVKIIVVDDDKITRDFVTTTLQYCVNRQIRTFADGFSAVEALRSGMEVDLMLADAYLPDQTGLELLASVKRSHPHLKFILMSNMPSDETAAREQGSDAFIGKPFSSNALFSLVEAFVVNAR